MRFAIIPVFVVAVALSACQSSAPQKTAEAKPEAGKGSEAAPLLAKSVNSVFVATTMPGWKASEALLAPGERRPGMQTVCLYKDEGAANLGGHGPWMVVSENNCVITKLGYEMLVLDPNEKIVYLAGKIHEGWRV